MQCNSRARAIARSVVVAAAVMTIGAMLSACAGTPGFGGSSSGSGTPTSGSSRGPGSSSGTGSTSGSASADLAGTWKLSSGTLDGAAMSSASSYPTLTLTALTSGSVKGSSGACVTAFEDTYRLGTVITSGSGSSAAGATSVTDIRYTGPRPQCMQQGQNDFAAYLAALSSVDRARFTTNTLTLTTSHGDEFEFDRA